VTLIAFHGNPAIRAKYLARVRAHRAADQIVHGQYWEDGKGCAVGCTIHSSDHASYETELGIPTALAYLEDRMFESMSNGKALEWPERFLKAVPVGADLSGVVPQFLAWLMLDETYGVAFTTTDEEIADLAAEVGLRYTAGDVDGPEATDLANRLRAAWAARDAWDARDAWAAWAARGARGARAAWDARDARAAWAARGARGARAAWDARDARAARGARDARAAFVQASGDVLVGLLENAPVPAKEAKVA
jgi:hypothetical protein